MGNAATRCESNVIGRQSRKLRIWKKRSGATRFASLFFFLALLTALAADSLSQDLSGYAEKLRSGNIEEKREALFQIRNLRSAEASRVAIAALSDKTPIVRATAASSVLFLPMPEASAALLPLLTDADEFVRREGAFALGEVGDISTGRQLIEALANDKSPEVKTAAALALGKLGDPAAVSMLIKVFDQKPTENNEMYRRAAARSIGQIAEKMRSGKVTALTPQNFLPEKYKDLGQKPTPDLLSHFGDAVKRLMRVLENSSEADDTRREAAFALGAIGDKSAETVLSRYTSSPDPFLAEICREALLKFKSTE
jgi:HEAT repeat protein